LNATSEVLVGLEGGVTGWVKGIVVGGDGDEGGLMGWVGSRGGSQVVVGGSK